MKRFIVLLAIAFLASVACYAEISHFRHGLSAATPEQEKASTNTVTGVMGDGDLFVYDDAQIVDDVHIGGNLTVVGTQSDAGLTADSKEAAIGIGGATSLTPVTITYPIVVISSGSDAVTMINTPFISTDTATYPEGTFVVVRGSGMAAITLQDEETNSVESGLRLGAATRVLNQNDEIGLRLMWDDTAKRYYWVEQYYRDYTGETLGLGNVGATALDARLTITGGEAKYAGVRLQADQSDDSGDDWELRANSADTEQLLFMNDQGGANVVVATMSNVGAVSFLGSITGESTIKTAGDADVNGGDVTVLAADANAATLTLKSDNSDDAGDDWALHALTNETLEIRNDNGGVNVAVATITNTGNVSFTGSVTGASIVSVGAITGTTIGGTNITDAGNTTTVGVTYMGAVATRSTHTSTGNWDVHGTVEASEITSGSNVTAIAGYILFYSRSEAELKVIDPGVVGKVYYDNTNFQLVVSTGPGAGAFGGVTGAAATGW